MISLSLLQIGNYTYLVSDTESPKELECECPNNIHSQNFFKKLCVTKHRVERRLHKEKYANC